MSPRRLVPLLHHAEVVTTGRAAANAAKRRSLHRRQRTLRRQSPVLLPSLALVIHAQVVNSGTTPSHAACPPKHLRRSRLLLQARLAQVVREVVILDSISSIVNHPK